VTREKSGPNFQYRVSLANVRKLKQPTFPDRTSLTAQLSFHGSGRIPSRIRFVGEEKSFSVADATLEDLLRFQKQLLKQAENRVSRNQPLEQTDKLINLVRSHDAIKSGITVREVAKLENESGADRGGKAKAPEKSTATSGTS
jgi:hypothetical protein